MIKFFKCYFLCLCLIFFSCTNATDTYEIDHATDNTIRASIQEIKESITWVGNGTEIDLEENTEIESELGVNSFDDYPSSLFFYNYHESALIFPTLAGFGNLDTFSMPNDLYDFIVDFATSLQSGDINSSFFSPEKPYIKIVFEYSLNNFPDITTFIVGEAFAFDDPSNAYEVPIRLYFEEGYVDCFVNCMFYESKYVIEQLDLGTIVYE